MRTILSELEQDTMARLERRALEKMLRALCAHTVQLIRDAREHGKLESRETDLQLQVFAERRKQAFLLLNDSRDEPVEIRIGRLERAVDAVESSRAYFQRIAAQVPAR